MSRLFQKIGLSSVKSNCRTRCSGYFVMLAIALLKVSIITVSAQMTDSDIGRYFGVNDLVESSEDAWPRHFRVGALVGLNLKASFGLSGSVLGISGSNPGQVGVPRTDHVYDDGYVLVDASDDPVATWNWGFDNANQYNAAQNRLYMHSSRSFAATSSADVNANAQVGVDMTYGGHLVRVYGALVGWEVGFGWLPISIKDKKPMTAVITRTVHSFDTTGLSEVEPTHGNYYGPGPQIDSTARAELDETDTSPNNITGSRELNVTLYNLRLGPTLHWELNSRFAFSLSAGGAMGIVDGNLDFDETIRLSDGSTTSNRGSIGSTEVVYGGYVAASLMYHTVEHGDFYIGVQYMTLGDTTISGQGRQANLDMSGGLYLSAGINWPF